MVFLTKNEDFEQCGIRKSNWKSQSFRGQELLIYKRLAYLTIFGENVDFALDIHCLFLTIFLLKTRFKKLSRCPKLDGYAIANFGVRVEHEVV